MKLTRYTRLATAVVAGALVLTACGGTTTPTRPTPATTRRHCPARSRSTVEHRGPADHGGRRAVPGGAAGVNVTVGTSGTGGGFEKFCAGETDISDASRPIKDEEKAACEDKGIKYAELHRRQRRPDRRGEQGQRLGRVPDGRAAQEDLGARAPRSTTGTRSTRGSRTSRSSSSAPAPTRARSTTSPTRSTARRRRSRTDYTPSEDDNVHRAGRVRHQGRPGLLRLHLLRGERRQAEGRRRSTAATGCVAPSAETAQDGTYTPLVPAAVHLPVKAASWPKPQVQGVRRLLRRRTSTRSPRRRKFVPLTAEQKTHARSRVRRPLAGLSRRDVSLDSTPSAAATSGAAGSPPLPASGSIEVLLRRRGAASRSPRRSASSSSLLVPTVEFFREVSIVEFFTGDRVDATVRRPAATASCRWSSATLWITADRAADRRSARARRRRSTCREYANPRRRARSSSRCWRSSPASPPSSTGSSP